MELGDLNKVWEIKALKKKPGHDDAKNILDRIAKQVQPIMRKHNWRVKLLSEFCPTNSRLLGLNVGGGVNIKLRLRRPNRDSEFFPYHEILDTMLHELCHNAHGPHNASFYQLWDKLREECVELMAKGITGTGGGFGLPGRRLGGTSRPFSSLSQTASAAAEKRKKLGSLLPSGPQRLGGDKNIMSALTPIQAAAMAAERRLHDDIWCASVNGDSVEEENDSHISETVSLKEKKAASSSAFNGNGGTNAQSSTAMCHNGSHHKGHISNFVNVCVDGSSCSIDDRDTRPRKRTCQADSSTYSQSKDNHPASNFVDLTADASTSGSMLYHRDEESAMWVCEMCTLLNPTLAPVCNACETIKPKDSVLKYKFWSCGFCTLENSVTVDKCSACDRWRYSHGPPVSARLPDVGT